MPQQPTFTEELMAAGRGVFSLIVGNREAGSYFNLSLSGLPGSFIALLLVTVLNACLPTIMGAVGNSITRNLLQNGLIYAAQIAVAALVLRQINRTEGFVSYLIVSNWATFVLTLILAALTAAGLINDVFVLAIGIAVLVIEVNIVRLIIGLPPLQVAMFLVAELAAVVVGFILLGALFPLPPVPAG